MPHPLFHVGVCVRWNVWRSTHGAATRISARGAHNEANGAIRRTVQILNARVRVGGEIGPLLALRASDRNQAREKPMAGTKSGSKKKATRKVARRKMSTAHAKSTYMRLERDLPPSLRDFSRRVRAGLTELEREIGRAQANPRREATRLLREASHALGRFEAEGERRWRKLTAPTRREAISLLHRLERALAPPKRRKPRAA
jgi:hypothetical protein